MYQVSQNHEGKNGVMTKIGLIENGYGHPRWQVIWEGRRKADAIAAADACPIRATVHRDHCSHIEYDNGKPPGNRVIDVPSSEIVRVIRGG